MFVRASTIILAIAAGLLAVPGTAAGTMPASECDTSGLQCCDSTMSSTDAANVVPSLLGLVLDPNTLVGLDCIPIPIIGTASGADCTQQPVCCNDVTQDGLVNIGCSPVNLNL